MPSRTVARLFVGVDPPPAVCERLAAWARAAARGSGLRVDEGAGGALRLLSAQSLHLTLCFLGERPVQEIDAIEAALDACAAEVGELSVGAPLWLPAKRPRALAIEIHDGARQLGRLHDALRRAICETTTWEPERRRFRAHITVARVRGGARDAQRSLAAQPQLPTTPQIGFTPESITLYSSRLAPGGAAYEALASSRLLPGEP